MYCCCAPASLVLHLISQRVNVHARMLSNVASALLLQHATVNCVGEPIIVKSRAACHSRKAEVLYRAAQLLFLKRAYHTITMVELL